MNKSAIFATTGSVIILLLTCLAVGFPRLVNKIRGIEPDNESYESLAVAGYYSIRHYPPQKYRDGIDIDSSEIRPECKDLTIELRIGEIAYPRHPDGSRPSGSLSYSFDYPVGDTKLDAAIIQWFRQQFEESEYERDFSLDDLLSAWLLVMKPNVKHTRTFRFVYADSACVTFEDSGCGYAPANEATFLIPSGERLTLDMLPSIHKLKPWILKACVSYHEASDMNEAQEKFSREKWTISQPRINKHGLNFDVETGFGNHFTVTIPSKEIRSLLTPSAKRFFLHS